MGNNAYTLTPKGLIMLGLKRKVQKSQTTETNKWSKVAKAKAGWISTTWHYHEDTYELALTHEPNDFRKLCDTLEGAESPPKIKFLVTQETKLLMLKLAILIGSEQLQELFCQLHTNAFPDWSANTRATPEEQSRARFTKACAKAFASTNQPTRIYFKNKGEIMTGVEICHPTGQDPTVSKMDSDELLQAMKNDLHALEPNKTPCAKCQESKEEGIPNVENH